MGLSPQSFYDSIAASYHLIYPDWEASIRWQGEVIGAMIRAELGRGPQGVTILDCSCGIGTQAIGLALGGYTVHATDISAPEIERAKAEAARLGASITAGIADFRTLAADVSGQFDVVLTFDNALPHLLTDPDLRAAGRNIAAKVRPGGLFMASIRDYDKIRSERPAFDGHRLLTGPDGRRIVFQMWGWDADGAAYTVEQFIMREVDRNWITEHYQARYRALTRAELETFLAEAGFTGIRWNLTDYYQPVVIARLPSEPSH